MTYARARFNSRETKAKLALELDRLEVQLRETQQKLVDLGIHRKNTA